MEEAEDQIQPLDLAAPLLSIRRIKPDQTASSEPVEEPRLVPFVWEQIPGRPKPPPGPIPKHSPVQEAYKAGEAAEDEEDEVSGTPDTPDSGSGVSRSFWKDPELGELMMGRFLAAAKTVAASRRNRDVVEYGMRRKAAAALRPEMGFRSGRGGHEVHAIEDSWEAVYTHKLTREDFARREDGSKLMSESNRLTNWSDSQSPDGSSSPYCRKGWKSGSFDSYEKSGESNLDRTHSTSPSDITLYVDSVQLVDTPKSKSSSVDEIGETNNGVDLGKIQEKNDAILATSLLPPPLPSAPSESWLHRTLPSVSSKNNPPPRSLLGIEVQHRKQPSWTSLNDLKWMTGGKMKYWFCMLILSHSDSGS